MNCELIVNTFSCLDQITWEMVILFSTFVILLGVAIYALLNMHF